MKPRTDLSLRFWHPLSKTMDVIENLCELSCPGGVGYLGEKDENGKFIFNSIIMLPLGKDVDGKTIYEFDVYEYPLRNGGTIHTVVTSNKDVLLSGRVVGNIYQKKQTQ